MEQGSKTTKLDSHPLRDTFLVRYPANGCCLQAGSPTLGSPIWDWVYNPSLNVPSHSSKLICFTKIKERNNETEIETLNSVNGCTGLAASQALRPFSCSISHAAPLKGPPQHGLPRSTWGHVWAPQNGRPKTESPRDEELPPYFRST